MTTIQTTVLVGDDDESADVDLGGPEFDESTAPDTERDTRPSGWAGQRPRYSYHVDADTVADAGLED